MIWYEAIAVVAIVALSLFVIVKSLKKGKKHGGC